MPIIEDVKRSFERLTGLGKPGPQELAASIRQRKPHLSRFRRDGSTPNNRVPLIVYRTPVAFPRRSDPAAVLEELFAAHGWHSSWRNGMYDFLHFHTRTHEVLGIARGHLRAEFGGSVGKTITLKAGDVVVLPAGTGHRRLAASSDLLVVGAYPGRGSYDEPEPGDIHHAKAIRDIDRVASPRQDPVYGKSGPLMTLWGGRQRPRKKPAAPRRKTPHNELRARTA
jgi:uncharacterized protein YjlB